MKSFFGLLESYGKSEYYPYHMPGHKRRMAGSLPQAMVEADITEIDDFDNLHNAKGVIQALQERAARIYESDETFYLVNGSTAGILSAISAAVPEGGHLLMARNCHKSAYHGAYLRNLRVEYLHPAMIEGTTIADAITPKQVKEALDADETFDAVLLISPTYEGRISNIEEIAKIVHEKGKILIVDEAHGAHLGLVEEVSPNSIKQGADLVIHSVHKTLPSPTQTALLHVNGDRVDREKLRRYLRIYQSSSPSYLLMAGIDSSMRLIETKGEELFEAFLKRYNQMMKDLSACKRFRFLQPKIGVQDVGKLVILTKDAGITGKELHALLRTNYKLQLEMAGGDYALAMFTIADTEEGFERMTKALLELDAILDQVENKEQVTLAGYSAITPEIVMPISMAWDAPRKRVLLEESHVCTAGEFVNIYPPGIPILAPGELITTEILDCINSYLAAGYEVQGIETIEKKLYITCLE